MKLQSYYQVIFLFVLVFFWFPTARASSHGSGARSTAFLQKKNYEHGAGLTGDFCESASDCVSPRECYDIDGRCSSSSSLCFCVPTSGGQSCTSSSECVPGEGCAILSGSRWCISCDYVARVGTVSFIDDALTCPGESKVCISAMHLREWRFYDLVYSRHQRASVLCDSHGSCATPGHMVVYYSHIMTMSRYCNRFSDICRPRVMFVNSPRMRHGLRISSFTEGLQFTLLAAKYETKVEETVLKALIHLGM